MKKLLLVCITILALLHTCMASGDNFSAGSRAAALGNASTTLSDVFSTTNNQAGLGFVNQYAIGIYTDRKFVNANINNFNLAVVLPFKNIGTFGLCANYYGYKSYNETKIGLAYARQFGQKVSFGIQFDYMRTTILENGNRNFFTLEAGIQYKPWNVLTIAAHVYNPIPYKVEKVYGERLPTILKFGLGYEPSKKVLLAVEYEQDIHYKPQFKAGVEYRPIKYLDIRAGVQTTPFSASLGVGVNVKGVNIDVSSSYHPVLGFTPQAALVVNFGKKITDTAPVKKKK
ncbi:MAG: hypothetical protein IPN22_00710 [Bacteroidetes bacterium]|nr:hypothetical protein [Bacteroidota bacterium]